MLKLDVGVAVYAPLQGSSYMKLPKELEDKKAILNIQNEEVLSVECSSGPSPSQP